MMIQASEDDLETRTDVLVPSPIAVNSACSSEHGEGASTSMSDYQYPPDIKYGIEELCPVCGDKVSGYHYGLQTCESCKGFFKRTVQNKKVYSCVDNRSCHIDKSQRKRCPFCRFQKCLSVGMKLEAVRTDRMRGGRNKFGPMYKRDRALKQQALRQRQQLLAQCQMQVNGAMSGLDLNMDPSLSMQQFGLHPHHHNSGFFNSGLQNMGPDSMPDIKPSLNMLMPSVLSQSADNHHQSHNHNQVVSSGAQMNLHGNRPSATHLGNMNNNLNMPMLSHSHSQAPPAGHMLSLKPLPPHSPNSDSENHSTSPSSVSLSMTTSASSQPVYVPQSHSNYPGLGSDVSYMLSGQFPHNLLPPQMPQTPPAVPALIKSLQVNELNEDEVQQKLAALTESQLAMLQQQHPEILQDQSKQWLQLTCRLTDQYLFLIVEWARSAIFFKEMKVEDQMKLLQNSWSELIVLDFIYKQRHNTSLDIFTLLTGHKISADTFSKLGLPEFRDRLRDLIRKFHDLKVDHHEYTCLKFLILLNPDVPGVNNARHLELSQEKINAALLEYCTMVHLDMKDKFGQLLLRLPEIRLLSLRIEEFLYYRHTMGDIPEQTLLMELLHSKRK